MTELEIFQATLPYVATFLGIMVAIICWFLKRLISVVDKVTVDLVAINNSVHELRGAFTTHLKSLKG